MKLFLLASILICFFQVILYAGNISTNKQNKKYYSFKDLKKGLQNQKFFFRKVPKPPDALVDLSKFQLRNEKLNNSKNNKNSAK